MTEQHPDAGADDVPAEVPDEVDSFAVVIEPTPLDEDDSEPDDSLAELDALLADENG